MSEILSAPKHTSGDPDEKVDRTFNYTFVGELFYRSLKIPGYQRPYRWQPKNVIQLLDDIKQNVPYQKFYRIGTVILHKDNKGYNIVDGQQRLVTISLILYYLRSLSSIEVSLPLMQEAFPHADSRNNIQNNFETIKDWFATEIEQSKKDFLDFLLYRCQLVEIVLKDISEAFQLFDSQNARGKPLEPYDLLKAFHLREMADETDVEKRLCVNSWEEAVNNGMLNNLGKYIFRIRKWARGDRAGEFSKEDIDEFKGINIKLATQYPFMRPFLITDVFLKEVAKNNLYKFMGMQTNFPFQLTQPIINGRLFFKMIEHYNEKYTMLFKQDNFVREFYIANCKYTGSHRLGDKYVRELFKALVLFYHDKYGFTDFEQATLTCYKWAYRLRLKQRRVFYNSIDKYVGERNFFEKLERSYQPQRISRFSVSLKDGEVQYDIPVAKKIFNN